MAKAAKPAAPTSAEDSFPLFSPTPKAAEAPKTVEKVSKTEAIRRCLAQNITKPAEGVEWIFNTFGLRIAPNVFSTTKSVLSKRESGGTVISSGRKAGRPPVAAPSAAPTGNGSPVALAKALKGLVQQYGAAEVQEMITVFSD
jgi:hypothetical protein